nr:MULTISPECIES: ABC transporter ATP-binding protein [Rhizobium/Agrobacterium group]
MRDVTIGYGAAAVLSDLTLAIPQGKATVLLGPNGCGKSTLLRALAGLLPVTAGSIFLGGRPVAGQSRKEVARSIALLSQNQTAPEGLTVIELIRQGRYPHRTLFGRWSPEDEAACEEAMMLTDTAAFAHRRFETLSGGQRQRVWIAMTLAQRAGILLLDEPTTYLDLSHQIEILSMMRSLVRDQGSTVVAVLHDINQAARYADHLVLMKDGVVVSEGSAGDVLTRETVRRVFDIEVDIIADPVSATPILVPRD